MMQITYRWLWQSKVRAEQLWVRYRAETWPGAVLFVVLGLVFALVLQQVLLQGLRRYGEGNVGIMNRVMQGQVDADILISGSSRAMFQYDPRIIEVETKLKSFNIGRNGTQLHEQFHLLKLFLRRNKRPAYLIQNLDMLSFSKNDDITDPKQYIPWLNHEDVYGPLFQQKRYYLVYRWCPLLAMVRAGGMQAAVSGLLKSGTAQTDEFKGYTPQYLAWNSDNLEKIKTQHPSGLRWTLDPQKMQTLADLLEISRENEIQVVLVYSPDYLEVHKYFPNRSETIQAFREIAGRFQVPFWDYSDDPISGDRSYFYNTQHRNQAGASIFSKSIARRLSVEIFSKHITSTASKGGV
jgi:hypothetical protein